MSENHSTEGQNYLLVVATMLIGVTLPMAVNPPSGVLDGHDASSERETAAIHYYSCLTFILIICSGTILIISHKYSFKKNIKLGILGLFINFSILGVMVAYNMILYFIFPLKMKLRIGFWILLPIYILFFILGTAISVQLIRFACVLKSKLSLSGYRKKVSFWTVLQEDVEVDQQ